MNIFDAHISGSLSVSSSAEISGDLNVLGIVSGSFSGDGSQISNIPASGVTGLNLTQIADGSVTASISSVDGLRVNTNTEITGALKINNVDLGTDDIVSITLTDAGGKYYINGVKNPRLSFIKGLKYRFYYDNNNVHPLLFSLTNDGEHNGGVIYSTGVSTGSDPFYVQIEITDATATTFYYFCDHHVGMGNSISVYSDFLNGQSSINLTSVDTGMYATTGSNNFTNIQRTSGSLVVTGSVDITGSMTLNGQPIGTGKLDETSFNSYTSSNDGRVSNLETSTGSLNTFTSSIDTTIKNKLNGDNVVSGSLQVNITGTTGYSTFSSSISTSIGTLSSNVDLTTSGLSSSIGSLSSSVATTTSGLGSSIQTLSSSVATTTNTLSSSVATTTSGISSSVGSLSSSIAITTLGLSSSIETISSSFSTINDTQNGKLTSIETSTSSLNTFTSSIDTTIKNKLNTESVVSGSSQILITGTSGYTDFSSSISTSIGGLSSSLVTYINGLSSSVATTTNDLSSSVSLTTSGLTVSISSLSSSAATTTSNLSSSIGSLSSSIATTDLNQTNRLDSIEGKTGSYATTGSNIFQGNQTITGSLYISQDLIVAGSSSIQHISSSIVNIADNIITVNAQNPSIRFGGLAVIDSGSSPQVSGSMLFDSTNNQWIFVHQNQSTLTSSVLLMGPETFNNIGGETYLTQNRIPKGTGIEHLNDSNITDTGTKVSINSNTEVTGTLKVTGVIGGPTITAIETSTSSLNTFTSSLLTAIELTGSNLTVRGDFLVKGTTTNVNTATLDVDNNLINLNGSGATFAGLRVKDTTAPSQISGSLLWDSTNDYWVAGQLGSEQRIIRETEFNNSVTRIGNVETSTGSLNSFTSSINTTIKNKLNSDGVVSGSVQVNHNATTNYDSNQHIDHTSVSISAGSGLSGGGTIASNRILTLDTGSVHFLDGVKKELNTEGVISGSVQVNHNTTTNYDANQHVDHTAVSISAGGGLSGGGTIASTRTLTLDTGSVHFLDGVKKELNTEGVISGSAQVTGITNSQLVNAGLNVGTTPIGLGRAGAAQTLTGVSIDGNAGTVTNGVYTTGDQTITGQKTFPSGIGNRPILSGGFISAISGDLNVDLWGISEDYYPSHATAANAYGIRWSGDTNDIHFVGAGTNRFIFDFDNGNLTAGGTLNGLTVSSGTISSGTWNGTAIGDSYISSATNWNTAYNKRPSSLGFTSSTVTLTLGDGNTITASVPTFNQNTTGSSASAPILTASGGLTTQQGSGTVGYVYALSSSTTGLFSAVDNSNSILTVNRHPDNYYSQLGFSSNGNLYYRSFSATAINTSQAWQTIWTSTSLTNLNQLTNGPGYLTGNQTITISGDGSGSGATSISLTVSKIQGIAFRNTASNDGVNANTLNANGTTYVTNIDGSSTNITGNATDGALYSQAYSSEWQHQIYGDYRTGIMYARGKNSGTWQSWKRVALSNATTFSSVTSVTFNHTLGTANLTAQVFDTNGDMFFPSNIRITSTQVIVTFASSRSGRLVVTG